jgi:hypothetical protein
MEERQAAFSLIFPPLPRLHDGGLPTRLSVTLVTAAYNISGTKPGLLTKKNSQFAAESPIRAAARLPSLGWAVTPMTLSI